MSPAEGRNHQPAVVRTHRPAVDRRTVARKASIGRRDTVRMSARRTVAEQPSN